MIDRTNQSEQLPTGIARRRFLGQVAIGTTAFTIVPRHALGVSGHTPPSERLNIAGVGMGGQGTGLIQRFADHNIVAATPIIGLDQASPTYQLDFVALGCDFDRFRALQDQSA